MSQRLGALILFASDLDQTVAFYRLIGLPLSVDDHNGNTGPVHYACKLEGGCHFAVFPAEGDTTAPGLNQPGGCFPGLTVDSVEGVIESMRSFGAPILQEPSEYPWGLRAVVQDPDGRPVEIYEPSD